MIRVLVCLSLLFLVSCKKEEKKEVRDVDKLMEESEGSFPQTVEDTKEFQKEVRQINKEIKEKSDKRIENINRELEKSKRQE